MTKVFMFRHQHSGVVTSHVFATTPTDKQLAPLIAKCEEVHGQEGWGMVVEAELLTAGEVPDLEVGLKVSGKANAANPGKIGVSGTGAVT